MNTILLQPTDVLFFRDGRPMGGASAGHGAAWPLPTATDAALHAALHRSALKGHDHDQRRGIERTAKDSRTFGSLVTAGPFPVKVAAGVPPAVSDPATRVDASTWFFPRPLDLTSASLAPTLLPATLDGTSSLPAPLCYAVTSTIAPSKDSPAKTWLSTAAYQRYLTAGASMDTDPAEAIDDREFSDAESAVGIGIDPETQTQDGERIYSAHYLRLCDDWRIGLFAKTDEKTHGQPNRRPDLIPDLIKTDGHIIIGGQQRLTTATLSPIGPLPLPRGRSSDFGERHLVKWVLFSPAIWPKITANPQLDIPEHTGGWLPNWVRQSDGKVMLRSGERQRRSYGGKHSRGFSSSSEIRARLVAALVPKPIVVTGWALPHEAADRAEGGAKPALLAVPAGAVYYFEANSEPDARALADALNWHGTVTGDPIKDFTTIKNRRSTLLGEKGFGLGICGTWQFYPGFANR